MATSLCISSYFCICTYCSTLILYKSASMKKIFTTVSVCLLIIAGTAAQVPVITSVSPQAAPAGTPVNISGNNFNTTPENNIVYFGTVRAVVNNASATSITATVPAGAIYQPITVKTDSLTAFSVQPFTTTYGTNLQLRNNSFTDPRMIAGARRPCMGDFDNDGRLDMATIINNNKISIFKNADSAGHAVFGTGITYNAPTYPDQIIAADLNADGKPDLALAATGSAAVSIYLNTSAGGTISFASPVHYGLTSDNYPYTLGANDIDGDGKTDLVISYAHQGTCFSVARNTTTGGIMSFAPRVNYAFGTVPGGSGNVGDANKIYVADIDGDGKPDVTSLSRFFPPFLIFRNTSTPGTISFAAKVSITSNRNTTIGNGNFDMKLADVDGDNRPDIIYASSDSSYLSVYRNTSSAGNISFTSKMNFPGAYSPVYVATNDLNGDGKPDMVLLSQDSVHVYQNNSTSGNISFLPQRLYKGIYTTQEIAIADIDADGKTDIVISGTDVNNNDLNRTWVLENIIDETGAQILCTISDSTVLEAGIVGSTYQWQRNTGSGFVNVTDDVNHSGSNNEKLILYHPPSSWTGYEYRCVVDGVNASTQYLKFTAIWTGNFNNQWENPLNWKCGQLPDANTDVIINSDALIINVNTQVRSITLAPGASVTVRPGVVLTVTN